MEEVAAFHGAPGSRHQCLLPLPEGAHRRRWLPWVSPWRAWRSVAPSSAPRSRLPTSRPGGPGTFPNIPISSQYHPNIIQYHPISQTFQTFSHLQSCYRPAVHLLHRSTVSPLKTSTLRSFSHVEQRSVSPGRRRCPQHRPWRHPPRRLIFLVLS